jgi:hypothetical protein
MLAEAGEKAATLLLGSIFAAASPYTGEGETRSAGVFTGTGLGSYVPAHRHRGEWGRGKSR